MGVPAERIFLMPYAVDNRRFIAASRLSAAERREMRASLGVGDDRPIVLYAGQIPAEKAPRRSAARGRAAEQGGRAASISRWSGPARWSRGCARWRAISA